MDMEIFYSVCEEGEGIVSTKLKYHRLMGLYICCYFYNLKRYQDDNKIVNQKSK